jgi:hypothetical protein
MARFYARHRLAVAALGKVRGTAAWLMTLLVVANAGLLLALTAGRARAEAPGEGYVPCCQKIVGGGHFCCADCCVQGSNCTTNEECT